MLLFLPISLFLLVIYSFCWPFTPVDDAYITYRFAQHWSQSLGPVFNRQQLPVEGYSSLLWLLLLTLLAKIGASLPLASQIAGSFCALGTILVTSLHDFPKRIHWLAVFSLVLCFPWCYHMVNGLETALFCLLLTLMTLTSFSPLLLAVLLPLTRPEGFVLVLVWALVQQWTQRRILRPVLLQVLLAGLVTLAQILARRLYYHDWIANSARAKMLPLGLAWPHGLLDLARFTLAVSGLGLAIVLIAVFLWRRRGQLEQKPAVARALFLLLAFPILATSGGDSFPLWRFFVPLTPILFSLTDTAFTSVLTQLKMPQRTQQVAHILGIIAFASLLMLPWNLLLPMVQLEGQWVQRWRAIALELAKVLPNSTKIAAAPIGALGYYTDFEVVDLVGLTDRHIAQLPADTTYFYPGHQRHDGPYALSLQPDLILLANGPLVQDKQTPFPTQQIRVYEQDLVNSPIFQRDYQLVCVPLSPQVSVQLFARKPLSQRPEWSCMHFGPRP